MGAILKGEGGRGRGSTYHYLGQGRKLNPSHITSNEFHITEILVTNSNLTVISLLRVTNVNEVPISSHIWVASTTFKQL